MKKLLLPIISLMFLFACTEKPTLKNEIEKLEVNSLADELKLLYRVDLLPQYRDHTMVEQISSYDTTGGNNDGFSGLYSYIRKENNNLVMAELKGPGIIERIWTPTPSESIIEFYFDGEEEPRISLPFIDLFSGDAYPFVNPVVGNEVGGYYCYLPIPYSGSCKIIYKGDDLYFHQIQYRNLSADNPIKSFPVEWSVEEKAELETAVRAWTEKRDFVIGQMDSVYINQKIIEESISIRPGEVKTIIDLVDGGRITGIEMGPPEVFTGLHKDLILEIYWDNDSLPAIKAPVHDLFGYAYGEPSMQSLVGGSSDGSNYLYLPMPFDEKARLRLIYKQRAEHEQKPHQLITRIRYSPLARNPEYEGKLYTEWRKVIRPEKGEPYVFQESKGKGHHVGTIQQAQGLKPGMTGFFEGDDSTIVDHKLRIHGTGSEDYFNGGWYALPNRWDKSFSLPIHGCLEYSLPFARTGGYRFYMTDKLPYYEQFYHTIEHGPVGNRYPVDYTSVAFYYSDTPPQHIMEPEGDLLDIFIPDTLMLLPNLLNVTVGINQTVEFRDWVKIVISGNEVRPVVVHMNEIPQGTYSMFLTYEEHPQGCEFSVWQRQQEVAAGLDSRGQETKVVEDQYIGDITLDEQYSTVSLRKDSGDPEEELIFYSITLVKKK